MKKNFTLLIVPLFSVALLLMAYSSGSPGGKSSSPGDGGATCTDCHSGSANAVADWISTNVPLTGYVPGNTYTITLTGTHSGVVKFGFEVTAEDDASAKVGTFIITDPGQTKLVNGNNSVTHTSGGTSPSGSTKTWTVDWTAPPAGTGDIGFYASFNAANGNGGTSGDVIYTTSLFITEMMANPEITGIVPDNAEQGESITSTISGSNTSWAGSPAVTLVFSGNPGEVITASSATATNATTISANFMIPSDASPGLWDVSVDALTLDDGFTVVEAVPAVSFMTPNTAFPGDNFTGTIFGENTSWTGTTPVVYLALNSNPAETIDGTNVVVISDTEIEADFDIPLTATTGVYDIHVDDLVRELGFTLLQLQPVLTSIDPDNGNQGALVSTSITGTNTSFTSGVTDVYLSNHDNPSEMITASSFNAVSDTELEADFDIPSDASAGLWDVNVDDLMLENAFTVNEVVMSLASIDPDNAIQGDMLTVNINGINTMWTNANPIVSLSNSANPSETIEASIVNVSNNTLLQADLSIPADASVGMWDVNVDDLMLEEGFEVHISIGISELSFETINVYPNPSTGLINLELSEEARVDIRDLSGSLKGSYNLISGTNRLDLSNYSGGIYLLNVVGENKSGQLKLVLR